MSKEKDLVIHDSEEEFDEALEEELGQGYGEDVSDELEETPSPPFEYEDDEEDESLDAYDPTEEFDD